MSDGEADTLLGERLREARKRAGVSQYFVAKKLGLSRPTMTAIENGSRKVRAGEMTTMADLYHVSVDWLLSREGDTPSKIDVAARALAKLKPEDFKTVMNVLESLSDPEPNEDDEP